MEFEFVNSNIKDIILIKPKLFRDERGYFMEFYQEDVFRKNGISCRFVQDNQSKSSKNTLRGLHYQAAPFAQDKLIRVVQGEVLDVAVDIRPDSPSYKKHVSFLLNDENMHQLFIPKGFAHGFLVKSDTAIIAYKTSGFYAPEADRGLCWNDPQLAIEWNCKTPLLSKKDNNQPLLEALNYDEI